MEKLKPCIFFASAHLPNHSLKTARLRKVQVQSSQFQNQKGVGNGCFQNAMVNSLMAPEGPNRLTQITSGTKSTNYRILVVNCKCCDHTIWIFC